MATTEEQRWSLLRKNVETRTSITMNRCNITFVPVGPPLPTISFVLWTPSCSKPVVVGLPCGAARHIDLGSVAPCAQDWDLPTLPILAYLPLYPAPCRIGPRSEKRIFSPFSA